MKQAIQKRKDIVFYIKMYPLVQIHPQAYQKSKAVMCAKDNAKALKMLEDAFDKKPLPAPSCETDVIDRNLKLGESLGISGTPHIIFMSGSSIGGAVPADELIKQITGE